MVDFNSLIICPKPFSYKLRIFFNLVHLARDALQNKRLSSTKKRWLSLFPSHAITTPCISTLCSTILIIEIKLSTQNKNKYGEKGSPWHKPLSDEKVMPVFPLTRIEYVTECKHVITKLIQPS